MEEIFILKANGFEIGVVGLEADLNGSMGGSS